MQVPKATERYQLPLKERFNNQNYKRIFSIKANNECNLANINVIRANKQMSVQIKGKPRKVTKLRDGSLLVEVN